MQCKYGDPTCPCQDGDLCHYEGSNPMNVPPAYVRSAIVRQFERGQIDGYAKASRKASTMLRSKTASKVKKSAAGLALSQRAKIQDAQDAVERT